MMLKPSLLAAALGLSLLIAGCTGEPDGSARAAATSSDLPVVTVYKSPTCGCCSKWIDHLEASGFAVEVEDRRDVSPVKREAGVPYDLASCHTALVDGYAVEGHVPASDVKRLLEERPDVAGIAVAGMPIGSPGMEYPDQPAQPYDVIAFEENGQRDVFARH